MTSGALHVIGVGPGDPELLTLKALRLIRATPILAFVAPIEGESRARATVAPHLDAGWMEPGRIEIAIPMPFSNQRGPAHAAYDAAAVQISAHLAAGRDVALLCEGDPMLYGSAINLIERLAPRFAIEITPGIASPLAAAAAARLPLARFGESWAVIPASLPEPALVRRIESADAVAIVKLGRHLAKVRAVLSQLGRAELTVYVEQATSAHQRVLALAEMDQDHAPYFSLLLVPRHGEAGR